VVNLDIRCTLFATEATMPITPQKQLRSIFFWNGDPFILAHSILPSLHHLSSLNARSGVTHLFSHNLTTETSIGCDTPVTVVF
jgi:hypothetical protein